MKHEIALKRPEERTTWDLFQVFFATVKCGSYKKAADYLLISPQAVCMALHDLESRLSQKIITHLPKNNMEIEKYPAPLMTSEGAKWYLVVSELTNKENIEERLSYFKRESMMPFGFEPIAYNMWQLSQRQFSSSHGEEPTFCLIKLSFKEDGKMKEFKILTTDGKISYIFMHFLPALLKYEEFFITLDSIHLLRDNHSELEQFDLIFLPYDIKHTDFLSEKIGQYKLQAYASKNNPFIKEIPKTFEELRKYPCIKRTLAGDLLTKHNQDVKKLNDLFKKSIEVSNGASYVESCKKGLGIGFLEEPIAYLNWPELEKIHVPDWDMPEITEYLAVNYNSTNHVLVQETREQLKKIFH